VKGVGVFGGGGGGGGEICGYGLLSSNTIQFIR